MTALLDRFSDRFLAIPLDQRREVLFNDTASMPLRLIRANPARPYLERYFLAAEAGEFLYLHRFVNGDGDRHTHNHPWKIATSLILAGSYEEARREGDGPTSHHRWVAGDRNVITAQTKHRIAFTEPETWTLFCHSEWVSDWGFEDDDGVIHRNQPDPDGTNRNWWTSQEAMLRHRVRTPMRPIPVEA